MALNDRDNVRNHQKLVLRTAYTIYCNNQLFGWREKMFLDDWFLENKRSFPWREDPTPYRVWISEGNAATNKSFRGDCLF